MCRKLCVIKYVRPFHGWWYFHPMNLRPGHHFYQGMVLCVLLCFARAAYGQDTSEQSWSIRASGHVYKGVGQAIAVRSNRLTELKRFDGGMAGISLLAERCVSRDAPEVKAGIALGFQGVETEGWDILGFALAQVRFRLHKGRVFNNWHIAYGWSFGTVHFDAPQQGAWVFNTGITVFDDERWSMTLDYHSLRTSSYVDHIGVSNQVLYRTEVSPHFSAIGVSLCYVLAP